MTIRSLEHSSLADSSTTGDGIDDVIDLTQYIKLLVMWWREIVLLTLFTIVGAFVYLVIQRINRIPTYEATATIAILRVKSDIIFDERYRTETDTGTMTMQASANSRRAALLGLASSGSIAQLVVDELSTILDEDEQEPNTLLSAIKAEIVKRADTRTESDLIAIHATGDSPTKAAIIANTWVKHYVEQVNTLYSQVPPEVLASVDSEMQVAQAEYQDAQDKLEAFVGDNQIKMLQRLISEKQGIIDALQSGKQTAIDALVDEELNARRQIISAYIGALSENRLLAFRTEQQAKRRLVGAYMNAEAQNQLLAIEKDRLARNLMFETFVTGQISTTMGVFTQQVTDSIAQLNQAYTLRNRLTGFLENARSLQEQIEAGGDATLDSSQLAVMLLKSQVFALLEDGLPANLQIGLDVSPDTTNSTAVQLDDISALVGVLETRVSALDEKIQSLSTQMVDNTIYQYLDGIRAPQLAVSAHITDALAVLASPSGSSDVVEAGNSLSLGQSSLSQAITEQYADLFEVGGLVTLSQELTNESDLASEIKTLYPELFVLGDVSELANDVWEESSLATATIQKAQELLQLDGLEDISAYTETAQRLNNAIGQLESEIRALEAQLEAENARRLQISQRRDLAWETFKTLSNKVAELQLGRNATDSEVRLAVPAILPTTPIPGISLIRNVALAGAVGLLLGIFIAFLASFMGREPFLRPKSAEVPS